LNHLTVPFKRSIFFPHPSVSFSSAHIRWRYKDVHSDFGHLRNKEVSVKMRHQANFWLWRVSICDK